MAKKKNQLSWNRRHEFARKKSNRRRVGHPVYIYGQNGTKYKYLTITHTPEVEKEADYELLKHNIDPDMDGKEPSYLKKKYSVSDRNSFEPPLKKYRFHPEDIPTVKKYKK
jgi:hypothetical protein